MRRMMVLVSVLGCLACALWADPPAAPTFQELMDPALYPDPQRGLVVESVEQGESAIHIRTTGADITLDVPSGIVHLSQRIGHARPLARLRFGKALEGVRITHSGPGLARLTIERPAMTIRVNGDSLFMLHVHDALAVAVERAIEPAWNASYGANHLIADEWGAFGLYCSEGALADAFDAYADTVARYPLPAMAVLWVGVCPPKPYDWERSLRDNVVWHWSRELGYPPDADLRAWKAHGNIVLLQSEVMLWKDWNLDFVPRLGEAEFARVRRTLHDLGMRFIVYTSPAYFLKGTDLERVAFNSFENFKGWPPSTVTGENMGLFLEAIRRVMKNYQPDGLYFDGQYIENPAALYALARSARDIVGEDGILEWHSTWALGQEHCYLPQADAYVDFILRGEGQDKGYGNFDYLRFFVSGYNINNCMGVICNNGPVGVTPSLARDVLKANARFHTIASWLAQPDCLRALETEYTAKLVPVLRQTVDAEIDARQVVVAGKAETARLENQALVAEPGWQAPLFIEEFEGLPEGQRAVSKANAAPFSIVDGCLRVEGHAHTYAYLRLPLDVKASGFVVKLRQGSDGGMSWGPAALLRWKNGSALRLGTRSDGQLQADVLGKQLVGAAHKPEEWVWLRARWLEQRGRIEYSTDGKTYTYLWSFEHGGALSGPTAELLVGKVPYNGEPEDYLEPGPLGACQIDLAQVF